MTKLDDTGYAAFEGVLSRTETHDLLTAVASISKSRAGARHLMSCSAVAAIASDPRLMKLARELLGSGATPYRATLFDKSIRGNWLVPWHQDTALPLQARVDRAGWGPWSLKDGVIYAQAPARALERIVALRVHLDDSTELNGPLRVVPGSHTLGVLDEIGLRRCVESREPVELTVRVGGIIRMRPLLVHASSKARSSAPRRVLHVEYASSVSFDDGLELRPA